MSEIPTAQELVETPPEDKNFKLAVVAELFPNSTAKVTFDGEEEASEKQYAYLSWYRPTAGDRVMMAAVGGTYIILGKIKFNENPDPPPSYPSNPDFSSIYVSGSSTFSNCEINGELNHDGDRIGFFGTSPITKRTVYYADSDTEVRTRLNDLIYALAQYGLIGARN
jgi:hypothetical protein